MSEGKAAGNLLTGGHRRSRVGRQLPHTSACSHKRMRRLFPVAIVALALLLPEGGGASATTRLNVSPKHGGPYTTYVVSFKAQFAASGATKTRYVIGAVNSGNCTRGVTSFGKINSGPYKVGQTVRFVVRFPKAGLCVGVFHGVAHWQKDDADRTRDVRMGRFAFRVLSGS